MNGRLEIKNLEYSYPDGRRALRGLNLQISPGEKVGVVGSNGAGKSTFLLQLNGVLRGSGLISVNGLELSRKTLHRIRADIGLVFQDPDDQLFSTTVYEDVSFGLHYMGLDPQEIKKRVSGALKVVEIEEMADRTPHHMSLGEKKLAAIATVLAMQPSILAFDEPTSALDARARRRVIKVLKQLKVTVIVATHDLSLVEESLTRMIILDQGKVVADGATSKLLNNSQLLVRHGLK